MKKVLIADDEFLVRLGLKSTINWEEHGFLIVDEARNGKEAVELFEKHDPDILLTDIRMPVMNGLELIQELKSRKKSLKTVILSHYEDFNYAREAIKLGTSEYILKSDLSSENLLEILKKISAEMDAEDLLVGKSAIDGENAALDEEGLRREFFNRIIKGGFKSLDDVKDYIDTNGVEFKYNSFIFVSGIIEDIHNTGFEKDHELFIRTINNILTQVFNERSSLYILRFESDGFTFLINSHNGANNHDVNKNVYDRIISFKKQIKQFLNVDLSLGISETGYHTSDMIELLAQSKKALQNCFFTESGIIGFDREMLQKKEGYPQISLEILKGHVKTFAINEITAYIGRIFQDLLQNRAIDSVKDAFMDLLSYAKIIAKEWNLKNVPALSEAKFSYGNFDKLYTINAAKIYIIDIYRTIVDYVSNNKPDNYSYIISKSIQFIKMNYHRNIALSEVAEHVEISSSYLSLLFKQETGINFSSFLTNYRIEMSKKLLIETNMKIYEIAEKVGFENPYYFSKVFKEITGMVCKDYKKNQFMKDHFESSL